MALFVDLTTNREQLQHLVGCVRALQIRKAGSETEEIKTKADSLSSESAAVVDVASFVIANHSLIFEAASPVEIETFWNLVAAATRNESETVQEQLLQQTLTAISSDVEHKSDLRLHLLANLFNFTERSQARPTIFIAILKYALASKQGDDVITQFERVGTWLEQWQANVSQRREIYKLMYNVLESVGKHRTLQAYELLQQHLITYESCSDDELKNATLLARECATQAIRLPNVHQCDGVLSLKAIQQLQKDTEEKSTVLFDILCLFADKQLNDLIAFHEKNPTGFETVGLSYEDCTKKMRLLTLASLGASQSELPYSTIAKELHIEGDDEVEQWVVLAISSGILRAKMDQLRLVVQVQGCTLRVFEKEQWNQLNKTISEWQETVKSLVDTVKTHKAQGVLNVPVETK